jgi:hypothetical protein
MSCSNGQKPKDTRSRGVDYALSIETWKLDYSFTVAGEKSRASEVYADSRHLRVQGTLSHPRKSAGRQIGLTFLPANDLLGLTARLYKSRPEGVGDMEPQRQRVRRRSVYP